MHLVDTDFKRKFYRMTDSLTSAAGKKLRSIEEKIFRENVLMVDDWSGGYQQNAEADIKIR